MDELIRKQDAADLLRMAIIDGWEPEYAEDKLKALPPVQPEILASGEGELNVPDTDVEDMISRQAAIDAADDMVEPQESEE